MVSNTDNALLGGTIVSKSSLDEVKAYYNTVGSNWGESYKSKNNEAPDPAVLRLNVVLKLIDKFDCDNFFDAGCADAPVMVELLKMAKKVRGVDFSNELIKQGKRRLEVNGFDPRLCDVGDVTCLKETSEIYDTVLCLGVLPHIYPMAPAIRELVRITRPGGTLILSFRNDLFDLFTFNRFTLEFFEDRFFAMVPFTDIERKKALEEIRNVITFPDKPETKTDGPYREFSQLTRINHNPLTIGEDMAQFGLDHLINGYYKFHPVPPLLENQFPNFSKIGAKMDETLSFSWLGIFMCSTFVAAFRKET